MSPDINERWTEPRVEVHPSAAGTRCVRSLQLGMLGHRTPELGTSTRRMLNGTWTHRRWNDFFRDTGLLFAVEHREEKEIERDGKRFKWSGEMDLVLRSPTNTLVVVEIKSMGSSRFKRIPQQGSPLETGKKFFESERRYAVQLCHYWSVAKELWSGVDKRAVFLLENTDTQEVATRWVEFTDEQVSEAFRVAAEGYDGLQQGILADPPYKRTSTNCKGCARRSVCFALQDGDPAVTEVVNERLRRVTVVEV